MKYLGLVPMAIFALALQGQTGNVASGTPQAGQPVAATNVSAELTKRIDTKNAKQGDEVDARVTTTAKLPDGTELPRGTKLIGKVTDVKAKTKEDKSSHLAFSLDRAVLKDGKELPVMVAVTSVTRPAQNSSEVMMSPAGGGSAPSSSGSSSGGTSSAPSAPSNPIVVNTGQPQSSAGVLKSEQDRVPVGNMPGVTLSGASPGAAGSLDAAGDNISLDSGTKMTLSVAPSGSHQGQ
jgi:hypothetical protein